MQSAAPAKRTLRRRIVRGLMCCIVIPYLGIVLLAAIFQRSLIYHPGRDAALNVTPSQISGARTVPVSFKTVDNLDLHGWHIVSNASEREDSGKVGNTGRKGNLSNGGPVFLYFCGNSGDRSHRIEEFTMLTGLEADVICFDYRGFGDNEGSPSESALADDAWAIWQFLSRERQVESDQVIIFGESLGGGVATRLAFDMSTRGAPPAGLVLRSTFSRLSDVAAGHFPWLPARLLLIDRFPSIERIAQVTCPILVIHGERDTIVPFELGKMLFAAAPEKSSQGIAKRFLPLKTADHNDVMFTEPQAVRRALEELLGAISPRATTPSNKK